jgi:hypothetical protein
MKQFLVTLVLALAVAGIALPQTVGVGVGPTFTQFNQLGDERPDQPREG